MLPPVAMLWSGAFWELQCLVLCDGWSRQKETTHYPYLQVCFYLDVFSCSGNCTCTLIFFLISDLFSYAETFSAGCRYTFNIYGCTETGHRLLEILTGYSQELSECCYWKCVCVCLLYLYIWQQYFFMKLIRHLLASHAQSRPKWI